jgi:hypothetical protein
MPMVKSSKNNERSGGLVEVIGVTGGGVADLGAFRLRTAIPTLLLVSPLLMIRSADRMAYHGEGLCGQISHEAWRTGSSWAT